MGSKDGTLTIRNPMGYYIHHLGRQELREVAEVAAPGHRAYMVEGSAYQAQGLRIMLAWLAGAVRWDGKSPLQGNWQGQHLPVGWKPGFLEPGAAHHPPASPTAVRSPGCSTYAEHLRAVLDGAWDRWGRASPPSGPCHAWTLEPTALPGLHHLTLNKRPPSF